MEWRTFWGISGLERLMNIRPAWLLAVVSSVTSMSMAQEAMQPPTEKKPAEKQPEKPIVAPVEKMQARPQQFTPGFEFVRASVFLTRNHREQAKSHLKFLRAVGVNTGPAKWRDIAGSFAADERRARAVLAKLGPVLSVTFENLVTAPMAMMAEVSVFVGERLDIKAASRQLRPRTTGAAVLPYMLEEILLSQATQ